MVRDQVWDPRETSTLVLVPPSSTLERTRPVRHGAENDSSTAQAHNCAETGAREQYFRFDRESTIFRFGEPQLPHSVWRCAHPITPVLSGEKIGIDLGTMGRRPSARLVGSTNV